MSSVDLSVCEEAVQRTKALEVPKMKERALQVLLGVVNIFFFGIGTLVAGFMTKNLADVLIGLLQLFLPLVGWLWSVAWGVLMLIEAAKGEGGYESIPAELSV